MIKILEGYKRNGRDKEMGKAFRSLRKRSSKAVEAVV
jgi:hypothetical protein